MKPFLSEQVMHCRFSSYYYFTALQYYGAAK